MFGIATRWTNKVSSPLHSRVFLDQSGWRMRGIQGLLANTDTHRSRVLRQGYRGTSLIRNSQPPGICIGP